MHWRFLFPISCVQNLLSTSTSAHSFFWTATPRETKSCRTRDFGSVVCLFGPPQALSGLKSAPSGLYSAFSVLKSAFSDSRPERADFGPERADFRPERADFGPYRAWGPGGVWTNGRTDGRTNKQKSPVFYRTSSPSSRCPKRTNWMLKVTNSNLWKDKQGQEMSNRCVLFRRKI